MSVHGPAGIDGGSSVPHGFWVTDLTCWHESHPSTYLLTHAVIEGQVKLQHNSIIVFALPVLPASLVMCWLLRIYYLIRSFSSTLICLMTSDIPLSPSTVSGCLSVAVIPTAWLRASTWPIVCGQLPGL